jgi:raffinose/stachyose/melibiose transport system permease protein
VGSRLEHALAYAILIVFSLLAILPIADVVLVALNPPGTLPSGAGLPKVWSLDSFAKAWTYGLVGQSLVNSFIVAAAVVIGSALLSIMSGYAFGTMRFPYQNAIFYYLLLGIMIPYQATIIPLYYEFRFLDLTDTYVAVILPQIAFSVSFGTFWMRAFFSTFPREIIEAARADGANPWQVLWLVAVPPAGPAILALAIILFIWTWNDLLIAIVMIQDPHLQLAPASLAFFSGAQYTEDLPVVAAAAVLVALPVVVMYALLQRQYIEGVVGGGVVG